MWDPYFFNNHNLSFYHHLNVMKSYIQIKFHYNSFQWKLFRLFSGTNSNWLWQLGMFSFWNIWQQATKLLTHLHWQRHRGWVCSNNRLCSASRKLLNELYVCFEKRNSSFILLSNPKCFVSLQNRNKATRYLWLTHLFTYFEYNFQDWIFQFVHYK